MDKEIWWNRTWCDRDKCWTIILRAVVMPEAEEEDAILENKFEEGLSTAVNTFA